MPEDNEAFRKLFANNIINVTFTKKDGTRRDMRCTLMVKYLPGQIDIEETISKKEHNPNVLAVWDMDNIGWRSFRLDSIIYYAIEGDYNKEAI